MAGLIMGRLARWGGALCVAALLAGCAGGPFGGPTRVKGTIAAAADLNPDRRGRASPVVLRLYELKTRTAFDAADFFSLYEREREALGAELVAVEEVQLAPGEQRALERTLQPGARFLGVLVAYRDIERAQWRASTPLRPNKSNALTIRVDGNRASIVVRD